MARMHLRDEYHERLYRWARYRQLDIGATRPVRADMLAFSAILLHPAARSTAAQPVSYDAKRLDCCRQLQLREAYLGLYRVVLPP
jgi:hypothetical protein